MTLFKNAGSAYAELVVREADGLHTYGAKPGETVSAPAAYADAMRRRGFVAEGDPPKEPAKPKAAKAPKKAAKGAKEPATAAKEAAPAKDAPPAPKAARGPEDAPGEQTSLLEEG